MSVSVIEFYKVVLARLRPIKDSFFPDEVRYQRIRFGLCRGCYLPLNMRHGIRVVLGLYEPEIIRYFKAFSSPGGCLYDIGASSGYYTLAFSRLAGAAHVYAIEPNQKQSAICKEVITRNRLKAKIEVHELFIGSSVDEGQRQETLDDLVFVKGFDKPTLVKIDVDGPEFEVLSGAAKVLAQCKPNLIVEVHSSQLETDCKALLERSGYTARIVKNNPLVQEKRPIELNRWLVATPQ
jgi:precorrin-6B methylase 2